MCCFVLQIIGVLKICYQGLDRLFTHTGIKRWKKKVKLIKYNVLQNFDPYIYIDLILTLKYSILHLWFHAGLCNRTIDDELEIWNFKNYAFCSFLCSIVILCWKNIYFWIYTIYSILTWLQHNFKKSKVD